MCVPRFGPLYRQLTREVTLGRLKGNEVLFTSVAFASANVAMPAASLYLESLSGSRYLQCKKRHTVQAHSGASRVEE